MSHTDQDLWCHANQDLIARSLSEFIYEEELTAEPLPDNQYQVTLGEDAVYQFQARPTLWHFLDINAASLQRNQQTANDALVFCLDLKQALQVDEIVCGNWLEDVQNTLSNDFERLQKLAPYSASDLLELPEPDLQGLLNAHPKIIANRGRLGWGHDDNALYAPESLHQFQLIYLAAHKSIVTKGHSSDTDNQQLLLSMMSPEQYQKLQDTLSEKLKDSNLSSDDFALMPCHPWQFQHKIKPQFQWALQSDQLIELGTTGDFYQAQQSIRTLSNVTRPSNYDVKLAITILNTSCYRGVPEKFIAAGYKISSWLNQLTQQDQVFQQADLRILQEPAGYYVSHRYQKQVKQAPYRYHEMLGCIWRQSAAAKCVADNEQSLLLSALLQCDLNGNALIKELINASGLTTEQWLQQLFKVMSTPLYHLLVKYGVGVIAHGQNVVVYFKHSVPIAIAIKDFHGDLRLLNQELPEQAELSTDAKDLLSKLPAEYLVHDLLTGHFISVYRFLSPLIEQQLNFKESSFYQLLAKELYQYQQQNPQYAERFQWFDLFREKVERVCLNKVRFEIGYQDNAERPLPTLASPMTNPIFQALQTKHRRDSNEQESPDPQTTDPQKKKDSSLAPTIQNSQKEQRL